jgi:hypothetical protein
MINGNATFSLRHDINLPRHLHRYEIIALHVFLAGDMIVSSLFYEFIGFSARSPILYLTVASIGFFVIRIIQKSYFPEILVFFGMLLVMIVQVAHFSSISHQPGNINSIAQYYPMLSFIVFANFITVDINRLLRIVYIYATIYVIVYLVSSVMIHLSMMPEYLVSRMAQSDVERGARIPIIAKTTLYCLYYSYFHFSSTKKRSFSLMTIICILTLMISQSRLLLIILLSVSVFSIIMPGRKSISYFSFGIFLALSFVILYGIVDLHWNPFAIFGDDSSARVRTRAYDTVRNIIINYPILGAGIAASDEAMAIFTLDETLSAADLGPIGIWFLFGIIGLIFYVISVYIQCFCTRSGGCGSVSNNKALQYTSCVIGLFGCLTPTWLNGSLTGLFISFYLRRREILEQKAHW